MLFAGEGIADVTPANDTVLAGFHYAPGKERKVTAVRQAAKVRALALRVNDTSAIILSIDIPCLSREVSMELQKRVEQATGVPAAHVRVCATHTHGMPSLRPLLHWGSVSDAFRDLVYARATEAAKAAMNDLSEADCYAGSQRVEGGNFNRTVKTWKTDVEFTAQSTDDERWLDTLLQALYFQRAENKKPLLWYHFCAHPVCYQDTQAGPDWPGIIAKGIEPEPGFLQGHIGDVNPGDGKKWIGEPMPTAQAIAPALHHAMGHGDIVEIDELKIVNDTVDLHFDMERFKAEMDFFKSHPEKCKDGVWVDETFAKAWSENAAQWNMNTTSYRAPISAMRLGSVALLFHPAELYSFYGLQLRAAAPFSNVLAVGYCDDFVGYLTDPKAYDNKEYAAIVVPKIMGWPPFTSECARHFTAQCQALLTKLV
ncbi:MAG: neutral/alkaline non-lysosomal ceramidase N-terminal domain-containing protein [Candidatus Hydrogenedentes bacterium]|nr:neutral/alkaline non-lysosomal ceramidase N-terminal domain-containing protein [Candidatus Hydrogenedentota bacterium]